MQHLIRPFNIIKSKKCYIRDFTAKNVSSVRYVICVMHFLNSKYISHGKLIEVKRITFLVTDVSKGYNLLRIPHKGNRMESLFRFFRFKN